MLSRVTVNNGMVYVNGTLLYAAPQGSKNTATDQQSMVLEVFKLLGITYPKFYKMDLMCKWGFVCAELLLGKTDLSSIADFRKAIVMQNKSSSLLTDGHFQDSMAIIASPALFVYTLPNIVMGEIAIRHSFKGENTFFVRTSSNENPLHTYIDLLFTNNIADIVIGANLEVSYDYYDIDFFLAEKKSGADLSMR